MIEVWNYSLVRHLWLTSNQCSQEYWQECFRKWTRWTDKLMLIGYTRSKKNYLKERYSVCREIHQWGMKKRIQIWTGIEFLVFQFLVPRIEFCTVMLRCVCVTVFVFSWMYFDSNEYDEMNEYMKASNIVFITIWYIQSLCTYIAKCWTNR